tara:strand:- start:4378 stop:4875 length:498 start_codon:yes stop_codon:yes gene_type:complete
MNKPTEIKRILYEVVVGLCRKKKSVSVGMAEMSNSIMYSISVDGTDQGKVVGVRGTNIKSIKNVFESIECDNKKINVFLDTADGESSAERFTPDPDWTVAPYIELLDDWIALFVDARVEGKDLGGVSVIECELYEDLDEGISNDVSSIISSMGKCNGGTINVTFV